MEHKIQAFTFGELSAWGYGNFDLLGKDYDGKRWHVPAVLTDTHREGNNVGMARLDEVERVTEKLVLEGGVLVGSYTTDILKRNAVVPLRWGAPRIMVTSAGMYGALGDDLRDELFRYARLWLHHYLPASHNERRTESVVSYEFDPRTDLVVSLARNPHNKVAIHGPRVNRAIRALSNPYPA